jgi:hypothetical protein
MSRDGTEGSAKHPISGVRLKASTCILFVRVLPDEESACMAALADGTARALRVRHPLPACERIRVVRPAVVVIGRMRDEDAGLVRDAAREVGSEVVDLRSLVAPSVQREALRRAVARATRVRAARVRQG